MKVLVTGGAGFIGSNIVKLLYKKGLDVVVFDNLSTGYKKNLDKFSGIKLVVGDIRNRNELIVASKGCQIIFHLAASVGNVKSLSDPILDSEVNIIGTLNVLEAAKINSVKKLIYSSSAAIFGELQYQPIDENHPLAPDSPYGVSKLAAEKHCLCFGRAYDLDIVCLRYFNVFGVNQRYDLYGNVIPIWANRLITNDSIIIYDDGEQTRDFIYVDDVAIANYQAAVNDKIYGSYNIGSGKSVTINFLADEIKRISRMNIQRFYKPPRNGEVRHCQSNISKAYNDFGFKPEVGLREGLTRYFEWFEGEYRNTK